MAAQKPVIHGMDHLPGGADPIPDIDTATVYTPQQAQEYLSNVSTPISGTGSAFMAFAHQSGPVLLDFTTPTQPKPLAAGVYAITANVYCGSAATTTNQFNITLQIIQAALGVQEFRQRSTSTLLTNIGYEQATVSWVGVFTSTSSDSFKLGVTNEDSVVRYFQVTNLAFTRILVP